MGRPAREVGGPPDTRRSRPAPLRRLPPPAHRTHRARSRTGTPAGRAVPVPDGRSVAGRQPRRPPAGALADGLTDEVRTACCDHRVKRWVLHLTDDQIASVAYVLWLHKTTGSALEANRFARDTGVTHRPAPAQRTAIPERTPLLHRPPSAVPADPHA
ncbi:DUF6417 family protein [Streptomyces sp. NPDC054950]